MNPNGRGECSGWEIKRERREGGGKEAERKRGRVNKTGVDSESQFGLKNCPSAIRSHPCIFCCSSKPIRLQ